MGIIATPLGWIMKGCYFVCKNYGIALLLFTILTRLIVFPLNVKQQKSMARMTMLQPELEKIKKKYAKNQQKMQEEQMNLYAKAGVNPMAVCQWSSQWSFCLLLSLLFTDLLPTFQTQIKRSLQTQTT